MVSLAADAQVGGLKRFVSPDLRPAKNLTDPVTLRNNAATRLQASEVEDIWLKVYFNLKD